MERSALERALGRLADRMRAQLGRLRQRGRTPAADRQAGLAIEPGEATLILDEISAEFARGGEPPVGGLATDVPPFQHAQRVFGLSDVERDALLVALAPELDVRFARLFGYLNDAVVGQRPTVGLIAALTAPRVHPGTVVDAFLPDRPLTRLALVTMSGGTAPLAAQSVAIPAAFWPLLAGREPSAPLATAACALLSELVLSPTVRADAAAVARWWQARPDGVVIVDGPSGAGREALAGGLAAARAAPLVMMAARDEVWPSAAEVARTARWHEGAVLLCEPPESMVRTLVDVDVPIAIVTERGGALAAALSRRPVALLSTPAFAQDARRELWQRAVPQLAADELAPLAARFRLGPARIEEVVRRARDRAVDGALGPRELASAAASSSALRFQGLATRVDPAEAPNLVVPPPTNRELALASAWASRRRDVLARDGVGAGLELSSGLVCLFWGPPGTGKSLAARRLAAAAGVDLYRVDLSQVVSKYIGETEKQLATVLDECERSDVAILFDEADALFGKRTAVRDAHDRYANIETGFLLQRLETTSALVILTSNLRENLDAAFTRRLHIVAEFPAPGRAERVELWHHLLPASWRAHAAIDVDYLAQFELRGGDIRNAIATALVTVDGDAPERMMRFLVWGVWRELVKAGRLVVAADFGPWEHLALSLGRGHGPSEISR